MTAPVAKRASDVAGLALGMVTVGSHVRDLDRDIGLFDGNTAYPVRRAESVVEATYQYQVKPWWQLQGAVQHTHKPGAGLVLNGNATDRLRIPNSLVLGLHTNISF